MLFPTLFSSIIFVFIAFTSSRANWRTTNPLSSYFLTIFSFIINNLVLSFIAIILLSLFFLLNLKFEKKYLFYKKLLFSALHIFAAMIIGFFISFFVLLLVAIIQLNILSTVININPNRLGVITDRGQVLNALKSNNRPPEIVASENDIFKELVTIAGATTGTTNVYGRSLLGSIPSFLVLPIRKQNSSMLLIDNTLIFSEINPKDLEIVSPVIGYLFVKNYFPLRKVKFPPAVNIMKISEYQEFRKKEAIKTSLNIDKEINSLTDKISSLSAVIEIEEDELSSTESAKLKTLLQIKSDYEKCLSLKLKESDCKTEQEKEMAEKNNKNKLNEDLKSKMEKDKKQLSEYKLYQDFYKAQKQLVQIQVRNAPDETGVFLPDNSINIALQTKNPHAIADYFATLTHEYLHFTSYISKEKRLDSPFFEEGLTEYFSRMIIKNDLNTSVNFGYPVQAKIISVMTNIIPESDFADIYFSKNQGLLEATLNRVYGDNFYKDTESLFNSLQYASSPEQELKLANDLMKKIRSAPLTQSDILSSPSEL